MSSGFHVWACFVDSRVYRGGISRSSAREIESNLTDVESSGVNRQLSTVRRHIAVWADENQHRFLLKHQKSRSTGRDIEPTVIVEKCSANGFILEGT